MNSVVKTENFSKGKSGAPRRTGVELFSGFLVWFSLAKQRMFLVALGRREEPGSNSVPTKTMS
jgi:hypothetical protein